MLTFGSLFAGIGGFDLGCERAGMRCEWQVEIDATCRELLAKRFSAEIQADVRTAMDLVQPDVICGGFPCQDLSVAGRRAGLAGERSGLWTEFARVIQELSPQWVVIENVPGLLSSNKGRDMGTILGTLAQLGYGTAYRVLDAQWFGVPQRRRRVFIVGCLGDWRRAAQVLFEPESLPWDPAPSRETGEGVAGTLDAGAHPGGCTGRDAESGGLDANALHTRPGGRMQAEDTYITHSLTAEGPIDMRQASRGETVTNNRKSGSGGPPGVGVGNDGDPAFTVSERGQAVAFAESQSGTRTGNVHATLDSNNGSRRQQGVIGAMGVRRLTPTECERLQGFPDGWTEGFSDSARYRMLGNAVAVPVAEWIGRRIVEVR